ncbi:MAG: ornithine cyclodeaminase family protein [Rhodobiaceae bacterium]|nr:ornithine cyclodeaminase family protein [Rhodobiaceae bacterium]
MRIISAADIAEALTERDLVEALRDGFRANIKLPLRHHHMIERPAGQDSTLLLMPAWSDFARGADPETGHIGIKMVTVFPDNAEKALPAVMGLYLLLSGATGAPLAIIDGQALTVWRTACASALAASYLAREDAGRMLMVGAGALAPFLVRAHAAVRPIREVAIWNRNPDKAHALARDLSRPDLKVTATEDLEAAAREADVISCATLSIEPLIRGEWLRPGTHVDTVGAFRPDMRETDDEVIRRARVFVDTRDGAMKEGGDIVQPLHSGVLAPDDIAGDLFDLCRKDRWGRVTAEEITYFKSVGTALEDLVAAELVYART